MRRPACAPPCTTQPAKLHSRKKNATAVIRPSHDLAVAILRTRERKEVTSTRSFLLVRNSNLAMDPSNTDVNSLTTLRLSAYSAPIATGRCLLAQFTDREVIVYQAYNPAIATYALEHQHFGGGFSFQRTSWIKPNFTWMMHRCGWASKQNQEVRKAICAHRSKGELRSIRRPQ